MMIGKMIIMAAEFYASIKCFFWLSMRKGSFATFGKLGSEVLCSGNVKTWEQTPVLLITADCILFLYSLHSTLFKEKQMKTKIVVLS